MKSLQKYFCIIFIFFVILFGGCKHPGNPSVGNSLTVSFSVIDKNGTNYSVIDNGTTHSTTVKNNEVTLTVKVDPLDAKILIDGKDTRSTSFTFANNGDEKQFKVVVTHNDATQEHTVSIRYYSGAVKKITVKDDEGKFVEPVTFSAPSTYTANVGTKKATVEVETLDSADIVKIDGNEAKTKDIEFGTGESLKAMQVVVTHGGADETYMVKLLYSDPKLTPKDALLTGITIKNAEDESKDFSLFPLFQAYNSSYKVFVPASVNKIKLEAMSNSGITAEVEGGAEHALNEGENTIKIKAIQTENPVNAYEYTVIVKKAAADASANAALGVLELESKWAGLPKDWKTAPAAFVKTTDTYTCTMDANCDEFFITAKPDEANAIMTATANGGAPVVLEAGKSFKFAPLVRGENIFVITVTAANAVDMQTYTIKATLPNGSYLLKNFSGDNGLSLFYAGAFEKAKKDSTVSKNFGATIPDTVTSTTITAEPEFPESTTMKIKINSGAEETFDGSKTVDLTHGYSDKYPNQVRVQIILASSTASDPRDTYTLWIQKVPPTGENENSLKDMTVKYYGNGYKFYKINLNETFTPEKTDYTLTLPYGIKTVRVEAEPKSSKAFIDGWGGKVGEFEAPFTEPLEIPVVAQNGERKVYKITVTQLTAASLTVTNIIDGQLINLETLSDGLTVTGAFEDPASSINEIWVGSSGLPIQLEKGGKWVKADVSGNTFNVVLPLDALKELPNGLRDIKVGAFNIHNNAVAIKRVPVTVAGNTIPTAPVTVKINSPFNIPANASMSIIALDETWYQKGEDVIFASKNIPVKNMSFPTNIPLYGIPVGHECRVEVYVHELILGKETLLYSEVVKLSVQQGSQNHCELTLKHAQ